MRDTVILWVLIIVFSFGLCLLGGQLTYWIWRDTLIAQIVGLVFGVIGILTAYKIWDRG